MENGGRGKTEIERGAVLASAGEWWGLPFESLATEDLAAEEALATGGAEVVAAETDLAGARIEGPVLNKPGAGRAALRHPGRGSADEVKRKKSAENRKLRAERLMLPARKRAWP
jgi:hypothetical protein